MTAAYTMTTPHPQDPIRQWMEKNGIAHVATDHPQPDSPLWIAWTHIDPKTRLVTCYAIEVEPAATLIERLNASLKVADPDPDVVERAHTLLRE